MTMPETSRPARWHESLIARILGLCVVLVLCLLGAVYILTNQYYRQVVRTMDRQAKEVAEHIRVLIENNPEFDPETMPEQIESPVAGTPVDLRLMAEVSDRDRLSPEISETGEMYFVATETIQLNDGRWVEMTIQLNVDPQTELIRAFTNRYLLILTIVFIVTLAAMVTLIARALRPLARLSDSCAKITEGNLEEVDVDASSSEVRSLEETFNGMVKALREKEQVEANLRQAQRLSAIGNLAAGVAHDVRNPLNAIKLLSGQALDEVESGNGNGQAAKAITTIRDEVLRLEDIVAGFLSLAKEEELRKEPQHVDPIIHESVELVRKDAEGRNVAISDELRTGDLVLPLDAPKLKRALLNVIINALEVCPEGGRIRVFSRVTDTGCEIEIRDDGPGMTQEQIEHAFDPYFTTKPTGTGLGLSITRGIIEEHGGTIGISSVLGHGTQVLITLPAGATASESLSETPGG